MPGIPGALASLGVGHGSMAAAAAAASRLGLSGLATAGGHNVLLVSNLNPEVSAPAGLQQQVSVGGGRGVKSFCCISHLHFAHCEF